MEELTRKVYNCCLEDHALRFTNEHGILTMVIKAGIDYVRCHLKGADIADLASAVSLALVSHKSTTVIEGKLSVDHVVSSEGASLVKLVIFNGGYVFLRDVHCFSLVVSLMAAYKEHCDQAKRQDEFLLNMARIYTGLLSVHQGLVDVSRYTRKFGRSVEVFVTSEDDLTILIQSISPLSETKIDRLISEIQNSYNELMDDTVVLVRSMEELEYYPQKMGAMICVATKVSVVAERITRNEK